MNELSPQRKNTALLTSEKIPGTLAGTGAFYHPDSAKRPFPESVSSQADTA